MDATTLLLLVRLVHAPARCDVRELPFAGTMEECMSIGWEPRAAEYLAERPWLTLRTAACAPGETA